MKNSSYNKIYKNFLLTPQTVPCLDRDFVEWHNGISHYGFWAVVIDDPDWIALWSMARTHIKRFINPDYQRAPHITIIACGLLDQNHFSTEQLDRQRRVLNKTKIPPFYLKAGSLNSFTTAPCIMIEDPTGTLMQIRCLLTAISEEDMPVQYQPHITLGFYQDVFSAVEIADWLARFNFAPVRPILVTELAFCVYETKEIQGRFRTMERIKLDSRPAIRSTL